MKRLLILLLLTANYAMAQPISGSFGSPATGTLIRNLYVADTGFMWIPGVSVRNPVNDASMDIMGALRYNKSLDSAALQIWTGYNWLKVGGLAPNYFNTNLTATGPRVHSMNNQNLTINDFSTLSYNSLVGSFYQTKFILNPLDISLRAYHFGTISAGFAANVVSDPFASMTAGTTTGVEVRAGVDSVSIRGAKVNITSLRTQKWGDSSRYATVLYDKVEKNLYVAYGYPGGGGGAETDPYFTASPAFGITTGNLTDWNTAYQKKINSAAVTGTGTKTMTFTRQDGTTFDASWTDQGITTETDPRSLHLDEPGTVQSGSFMVSGYAAIGGTVYTPYVAISPTNNANIAWAAFSASPGGTYYMRLEGVSSGNYLPAFSAKADPVYNSAWFMHTLESDILRTWGAWNFDVRGPSGIIANQNIATFSNYANVKVTFDPVGNISTLGNYQSDILDTDNTPPTTTGTTRILVVDAAGKFSSITPASITPSLQAVTTVGNTTNTDIMLQDPGTSTTVVELTSTDGDGGRIAIINVVDLDRMTVGPREILWSNNAGDVGSRLDMATLQNSIVRHVYMPADNATDTLATRWYARQAVWDIVGAGSAPTWGSITGTLSSQTDLQTALNAKQNSITLTTTGTSGAATLVGSTLNIPVYTAPTETDPVFTASDAFNITATNKINWTAGYNDKINSAAVTGTTSKTITLTQQDGGTVTATFTDLGVGTESDPVYTAAPASGITGTNITNWNTAYGWGNHASAGYLTSLAHNHGIANAAGTNQFSFGVNDDVRFEGTGQASVSFTAGTKKVTINVPAAAAETDPVFGASAASSITGTDKTNWTAGYNDKVASAAFSGTTTKTLTLTQQDGGTVTASFMDLGGTETDPVFVASPANGITATNITNWGTAYDKYVNSASVNTTGSPRTMTFTRRDGTTFTSNLFTLISAPVSLSDALMTSGDLYNTFITKANSTVLTDYTAGAKQSFDASATTAGLRHVPETADPSVLVDGDMWLDGKQGLHVRSNSFTWLTPMTTFVSPSSDFALSNVNTAQPIFPAANDAMNVQANTTYEFELVLLQKFSTAPVSNSLSILFAGTATVSSITWIANATSSAAGSAAAPSMVEGIAATAVTVLAAGTTVSRKVILRGVVRIGASGGTFIPQLQFSAAPGGTPVTTRNSCFILRPMMTDTEGAVGAAN